MSILGDLHRVFIQAQWFNVWITNSSIFLYTALIKLIELNMLSA